jgi:DNA-binding response OmpR family regulator
MSAARPGVLAAVDVEVQDPVVSTRGLTKRFAEVVAVEDLTFSLAAGTITGFLGPNGAGKTTTLRLLLGLAEPDGGDALVFGDLSLDPGTREVRRGERPIELTRTEFNLLELFLRNPRQVLTRSLIFDRVWGYDFGPSSNALEVYIGYLRRKLGEPRLLHTVRGVGYALRER